jgi:hypothetical protein
MRALLVVVCACSPLAVSAAERLNVKTGLWEMTSATQMSGMPPLPKEMLEKLTPEQRAQIEATIKQSSGPRTDVSRDCVTERDLERPFEAGDREECKYELVRSTRTSQEWKLACTGDVQGSGFFKINTPTPETMNGVLDISVGNGDSRMTVKADIKGRWLGADCGEEADDEYDDSEEDEG